MKIDQRAAAFFGDATHGSVDGLAASAPSGPEDISDQTVGVHAHQHRLIAIVLDIPFDHGNVRVSVDFRFIYNHAELAVGSGNRGLGHAPHVAFVGHTVADELRHGEHLQIVQTAEIGELRHARHGAVVIHDFADHASGNQSGETGEVDGSFG